jgi:hypothetical protein
MFFKGIGKGCSCFNIRFYLLKDFFECFIWFLIGKYFNPLDLGQPGIDHGRELPGKENQVLCRDFWL